VGGRKFMDAETLVMRPQSFVILKPLA